MNIIFIRHGDPDYVNDTLTENGHEEAKKLSTFLTNTPIDAIYQSPNGRAKHTCEYTTKIKGIKPITLEWLREVGIKRGELYLWNAPGSLFLSGTSLPEYKTCLDDDGEMPEGKTQFDRVSKGFDEIMAEFGYEKKGYLYQFVNPSNKTIAFFCHHGVIVTLLSYLLHWSLPLIFVHTRIDTTGVVILTMAEHENVAQPKLVTFNSLAHLM
jgi:broad specificity phosphatase PhoE